MVQPIEVPYKYCAHANSTSVSSTPVGNTEEEESDLINFVCERDLDFKMRAYQVSAVIYYRKNILIFIAIRLFTILLKISVFFK